MFTNCPMTKVMNNYQLFTFWWFKSLFPAFTNMNHYYLSKEAPPDLQIAV